MGAAADELFHKETERSELDHSGWGIWNSLKKKKKKTFLWLNKNRKTFFFEGFISPLHCVAYFSLKTFQDVRVKSVEHNIDRDIDQAKYWLIVLIACWAVGNSLEINQWVFFVVFFKSSRNTSITWTLIIVLNAKVEPASTPTQSENTSDSISVWQKPSSPLYSASFPSGRWRGRGTSGMTSLP